MVTQRGPRVVALGAVEILVSPSGRRDGVSRMPSKSSRSVPFSQSSRGRMPSARRAVGVVLRAALARCSRRRVRSRWNSPARSSSLVRSASGSNGAGVLVEAPGRVLLEHLLDLLVELERGGDRLQQLRIDACCELRLHGASCCGKAPRREGFISGLHCGSARRGRPCDVRVLDDDRGRAFGQHGALADDVGAVADAQRLAHVVVGDQHADAAALGS